MIRVLKYNEAKFKITQMIQQDGLQVGDKLMPERELAAQLGMSIISVRRALEEFQDAGIVRKVSGVGTFYSGNLKVETYQVKVALVNIDDYLYPDSYSIWALEEALVPYHGTYKIFHVRTDVQPEVLDELREFDKIMVTGFLNASWIECLGSLGKPTLQIGDSTFKTTLSKVIPDWSDAIGRVFEQFPEVDRRRFAFLLPHSETSTYATQMREFIVSYLNKLGILPNESLLAPIPRHMPIAAVNEFLARVNGDFDVLVIENGSLLPFLLSPERNNIKDEIPRLVMRGVVNLPDDFQGLGNYYELTFECNILTRAVDLFFNEPCDFFSSNETDYIKAKIITPNKGSKR